MYMFLMVFHSSYWEFVQFMILLPCLQTQHYWILKKLYVKISWHRTFKQIMFKIMYEQQPSQLCVVGRECRKRPVPALRFTLFWHSISVQSTVKGLLDIALFTLSLVFLCRLFSENIGKVQTFARIRSAPLELQLPNEVWAEQWLVRKLDCLRKDRGCSYAGEKKMVVSLVRISIIEGKLQCTILN